MNNNLAHLITDYQASVRAAVELMQQSGIPLPATNTDWAATDIPQRGEVEGGIPYFKHGYGCATASRCLGRHLTIHSIRSRFAARLNSSVRHHGNLLVRNGFCSLAGGFVGFTLCWVAWGLATSGDHFPWSSWTYPSLGAVAIVGGAVGWATCGTRARYMCVALCVASAAFWFLAPDGWWAHEALPNVAVGA